MSISYGVHSKISVQIKSLSYFQTIENGDFLPGRRHAQIVNLERWLLPDARMQPTAMMAGTWQLPVQEGVNNMARRSRCLRYPL